MTRFSTDQLAFARSKTGDMVRAESIEFLRTDVLGLVSPILVG